MTFANNPEPADYRPFEEWPTFGALANGFDDFLPPSTSKLVGLTFDHKFENGWRLRHDFTQDKVQWQMLEGERAGTSGYAEYKAYEFRPDMFMVDFFKEDHEQLVTLILNTATGQLKACISGWVDKNGERRTWTTFMNAVSVIGVAGDEKSVTSYNHTAELVGKHCLYRYSERNAYEHFYVNPRTFAWHCLAGTQKNLADAEQCDTFKLGENLYLFFWTETLLPVESIIVIDLEKLRSIGRFLCWDPKPQAKVHVRFASEATILNQVNLAAELEKPLKDTWGAL
ncbi:hypothetical protein FOPG_17813 [Fusarium oxysporum f. sp. conglutinans race 2 54008]|uniref:Uncharacterized protein n=3 Tax=Fusarium oxysporum f. sp. conglutinans TaxID=100902 RepID=A0A8H6GYM7_FUSOX|nr:hypothetical protein FOXB_17259 [Fusarium oxysporum f. sp. conglutinans Fo5176]EXL65993.1 hypothetical protein FOPG_17813 [Fusarium oxysporum f. sp. conglutinans race 2 54008]KAF6525855.1 hypothetical protein HZS61_011650 [Fusarium oxysporum f. sp. conglutinans]KAG6996124.1 Protein MoaF [Fusarium oxysporum f. sp. conglutinans]KAI8410920.1 hypothetical protein FOFC_07514 [Fusarium oxysporum]